MMGNNKTNVDQQRNVQLLKEQRDQIVRQFWNKIRTIFTKKVVIRPTEYAKINTKISIDMPNDIYATIAIMPTLWKFGLKLY